MTGAEQCYRRWLDYAGLDEETRAELLELAGEPGAITERFGSELAFGTGGMRGILGAGLNRMNRYLVRRATQGLADLVNRRNSGAAPQVALAYDTRHFSREFALEAALVLAANGIRARLFSGARPTPELSFAVRELGCAAGVVITASHNPPRYNGYKVYGPGGGQAVSPLIDELTAAIAKIDLFKDVKIAAEREARRKGLLQPIGEEMDRLYLDRVRGLSLTCPAGPLTVVFTPLHGTGAAHIPALLGERNFVHLAVVEEQMRPDPDFSTVRVPNPEEKEAFTLALELARKVGADLVMATDPDCDRVGCAVPEAGGGYTLLTGNQVGALLLEYLLSRLKARGDLPEDGVMVTTIVSGKLARAVAESYGIRTVETLTGFKFIGDKMRELEESGRGSFLFGYEESCGYLAGTFVRDKDAVIAAYLLAEMAAFYKQQGLSLPAVLEGLYRRHGYYREDLVSVSLEDLAEADRLMSAFAAAPPPAEGLEPAERRDYGRGMAVDLRTGQEWPLDLPLSPALFYRYTDGSWFCVRPSGTEPKVKIYLAVRDESAAAAEAKLARLRRAVLALCPAP